MRMLFASVGVLGLAGAASAQFPTQSMTGPTVPFNPNNFMPNIFNPQTQPLSPYLNLLRGGNVATNYFFGVRPGTIGLGVQGFGGAPFVAPGGNRAVFFPQLATAPDPAQAGIGIGQPGVLPPAGHPVVFNNTGGFFPAPGVQAGTGQPGLAGIGNQPRPARKQ